MKLMPLAGLVPIISMVVLEFVDVSQLTLSKAALTDGSSSFVLVVYTNGLAALILLPCSFLFQRSKRPPLTLSVLYKFFLLSFVGVTLMQNCVILGISYSSPTLSTAMSNLIPAFTFLLAVIFRMEKVDLRSSTCQAKIMGTLVLISGALIVTLYKGPAVGSLLVQSQSISSEDSFASQPSLFDILPTENSDWLLGALFNAIAFLSLSIWYTYQAALLKGYPSELTQVAFCCLFGTMQCAAISLFVERNNPSAWKISFNIELCSVIYSALVGSILTYYIQAWCIHKKGPVFVAMFAPMSIGIAEIFSIVFLGDTLHVGSVIGASVIVVGFYGVVWAQSRQDENESHGVDQLPLSSDTTPLLQSDHMLV